MIELKNLTKVYRMHHSSTTALSGINLKIEKGEIFGIIGLSGAGKSSLIRSINLLEKPTSGEVLIQGRRIDLLKGKALRDARIKIGMIFQEFNLLSSKTVFDNIALPLKLQKKSHKEIKVSVQSLLQRVGLEDKAEAFPNQLSGGQKQRVGIARALANDPDILLCDEATSALDPKTTGQILELLSEINRVSGVTIVLITHEMQVVQKICNRTAFISEGKIEAIGGTKQVLKHKKLLSFTGLKNS